MENNLFPDFLCVLIYVFCPFAFTIPDCKQRVAFTGNKFIAPYRSTLQVLLIIRFENKQFNSVSIRKISSTLINAPGSTTDNSGWLELIHGKEFSDVGIFNASASYYCEFHELFFIIAQIYKIKALINEFINNFYVFADIFLMKNARNASPKKTHAHGR